MRCQRLIVWICTGLILGACSVRRIAVNAVADSFSESDAGAYQTDDDPVLVGEALPFSLKLMEAILQETPEHRGLLVTTASGFVQYGHAYVLRPALRIESTDFETSRQEVARAKRLFLRARTYAIRALEVDHPGIVDRLRTEPAAAAGEFARADVPAMYWYAAALASAISVDTGDMQLVADLPQIRTLCLRTLELDETWNHGAVHELLITIEAGGASTGGAGRDEAEAHFARAMEINEGRLVSPLVTLAEAVCVPTQDRQRFVSLLREALAFDADAYPEHRLANLLAQQHARWLLTQVDELFYRDQQETYVSGG